MRTTMDLDEDLINKLVKECGAHSKTEAIETAAREHLKMLARERLIASFGKLKIEPIYKQTRRLDKARLASLNRRRRAN